MIYGRPALAALRMQRDALHKLYRTYESDSTARMEPRASNGSGGIARGTFLKVVGRVDTSKERKTFGIDVTTKTVLAEDSVPFRTRQNRSITPHTARALS